MVEKTAEGTIVQYETGAKARVRSTPHFFHVFDLPVETLPDLQQLSLPDVEAPERRKGFRSDVVRLKERGEYTVGWVNGFFSGCHDFRCDHQDLLMNLHLDPVLVAAMFRKMGTWNLQAAHQMCESGVDCIGFVEDVGSAQNLLFPPAVYEELLFPWHRSLCNLAHSYGVHVDMHSHGNINKIPKSVVDTGIDMLNPLDPTEGMNRSRSRIVLATG